MCVKSIARAVRPIKLDCTPRYDMRYTSRSHFQPTGALGPTHMHKHPVYGDTTAKSTTGDRTETSEAKVYSPP